MTPLTITGLVSGLIVGWLGVFASFRAMADRHTTNLEKTISNAVKFGVMEARRDILDTVATKYHTIQMSEEMHKSLTTSQKDCVARINDLELRVEVIDKDTNSWRSKLVSVLTAILSALQSVAEEHPALHLGKALESAQDSLREVQ